jgi:hypothetical protein
VTASSVRTPRAAGMAQPSHFGCWAEPVAWLWPTTIYQFFVFSQKYFLIKIFQKII